MGRLIKLVFLLLVLGFIGLTGFAYFGDFAPEGQEMKIPLVLHAE